MEKKMEKKNTLSPGSIGLWGSIIMGIAGTAPAFSIEVTAATIIAAVGVLSLGSILYCGLIMFGITFAYLNLNKMSQNAGAAYAWVGQIFGPTWGFFAGWSLLVASCLFMVSGTVPAANAFLLIFAPEHVNNVHIITIIAGVLLTLISFIVIKGIKVSIYAQVAMTIIEVVILLIIAIASFTIFTHFPVHSFSFDWFSPAHFTLSSFTNGALIGIFFCWGWDVVMNLNEETKDPAITPGRGALWSMVCLLCFFLLFMTIVLLGLTDAEIQEYNTNVIYGVANKLYGHTFALLAIIAVLLSTVGTLETSILQFTRTLFAKGRDGVLHPRFGKLHEKWKTPYVSVLFIWGIGMTLLLLSSFIPTVNQILKYFISAIGFQISFYLGLAGLACAWHYRKMGKSIGLSSLTHVYWPLVSALFLFFIGIYGAFSFDLLTNIVGIGGILFGVIPFLLNKRRVATTGV